MSLSLSLVFDANVTGNQPAWVTESMNVLGTLKPMWTAAGVYDALYNSHGLECGQFISTLEAGLADMKYNAPKYVDLAGNYSNYRFAIKFLDSWIEDCKKYPKAQIYARK